jgi:hypothetical protein
MALNILGENINTEKTSIEFTLEAGVEVFLEVNTEKTKFMFVSRHQNAGQNSMLLVKL